MTNNNIAKVTIINIYKHKKLIITIELQDGVVVVKPLIKGIEMEVEMINTPILNTTYKITDYKIIYDKQ